jgi:hypothetical protein
VRKIFHPSWKTFSERKYKIIFDSPSGLWNTRFNIVSGDWNYFHNKRQIPEVNWSILWRLAESLKDECFLRRVRRIRNFFYLLRRGTKRLWILFASYSHVSVYSQTPFIRIIRFKIFAQIRIQIFNLFASKGKFAYFFIRFAYKICWFASMQTKQRRPVLSASKLLIFAAYTLIVASNRISLRTLFRR